MTKVKGSWIAVVAAALLLGTLAGVVWARPNDRPGAQEGTRKVTLGGADFICTSHYWQYSNGAGYVSCESGTCAFAAPIVFPTLSSVTVERIKLHVYDNNGTEWAGAYLYRENPSTATSTQLASVYSPDGANGSIQTYSSAAINKVVWPSQRAFISLYLGGPNIDVYGVTVEYHRNP